MSSSRWGGGRLAPWMVSGLLAASLGSATAQISPFTEEAVSRGLVYVMAPDGGHAGFGCALVDLDDDLDADAVILGSNSGDAGVFENDGSGQFSDRSVTSDLPSLLTSAIVAGDYDRDGDIDLYITRIGPPNMLARNDGGYLFTDVASTAGVTSAILGSEAAAFADYDNDGWLDLYVANYLGTGGDGKNDLYHNLGDGTFEEVGAAMGVDDGGLGFEALWFDYDLDGDPDLYVSNDKAAFPPFLPNKLFRNDDGQLTDVSVSSGAGVTLESMGVACGDFDGNGLPDLYCTNNPGGGGINNPLLLNVDGQSFVDAAPAMGVDNPFSSWGAAFWDFDNDRRMDLYVDNGNMPNTLYSCDENGLCSELAAAYGVQGNAGLSYSSAVGDVDLDGDLDLLVNNHTFNVELFINHEGEKRNWLQVDVRDRAGRVAVGARVEARVQRTWMHREILSGGNGYKSQNDLLVHFGLDDAPYVEELVVTWPGGSPVRRLTHVAANQVLTVAPVPGDRYTTETQVEHD